MSSPECYPHVSLYMDIPVPTRVYSSLHPHVWRDSSPTYMTYSTPCPRFFKQKHFECDGRLRTKYKKMVPNPVGKEIRCFCYHMVRENGFGELVPTPNNEEFACVRLGITPGNDLEKLKDGFYSYFKLVIDGEDEQGRNVHWKVPCHASLHPHYFTPGQYHLKREFWELVPEMKALTFTNYIVDIRLVQKEGQHLVAFLDSE